MASAQDLKEEEEKYAESKEKMRKTINELRGTIQSMMDENETLSDLERLANQEFNLDIEQRKQQEAFMNKEVARVRREIELEILSKCYLCDVLKRECWDSLMVKGKAIKGFSSRKEVKNFPLRDRPKEEMEELLRVQKIREIETAALGDWKNRSSLEEEEQPEEEAQPDNPAQTGSFSAQLGCSNHFIYNQFSLQTTDQRMNQIVLLQDVIYRIKKGFNTEFDATCKQKLQEMNRVRDRNKHIREILEELDVKQDLWQPSLSIGEQPERLFTVEDSEIKAEKYLTPEQKQEEEKKRLEEESLADKTDDCKDRALEKMMNGTLELKKENILQIEIPPPEFVENKDEGYWTEDEKRLFKAYEKKTKELNERKEKYRKSLEIEIKKLQAATSESTKKFDDTLMKLFEKKIKCELAIHQEKLKIVYLVYTTIIAEDIRNQETELKTKLDQVTVHKEELEVELEMREKDVQSLNDIYDSVVAEDKALEKDFKKEFREVSQHILDSLNKLFKLRPKVQKSKPQTDQAPHKHHDRSRSGTIASEMSIKTLRAMDELDHHDHMPEGLNPSLWKKFCHVRRVKIESERRVKDKASAVANMQATLQKKKKDYKADECQIKNLIDELKSLQKEKKRHLTNIMVQVVLKQGQVCTTNMAADVSEYVLLNRAVVEGLNNTIKTLGEKKIASMVERKDFRKGTFLLEWEHKVLRGKIKDLKIKLRDIQKLHLNEEQKDYLLASDQTNRVSKQVSTMERTIHFLGLAHQHNVNNCKKEIENINRQVAIKIEKNKVLEQQLPELRVTVAERKHIYQGLDLGNVEAAKVAQRYREIVKKKRLEECVQAQKEELVFLHLDVDHRRKNRFISELDELSNR